jgi:hypothetical protein
MALIVTYTNTIINVISTDVGGNSIDEVCTAINNSSVMERTGTNPYTYQIKQGVGVMYARNLILASGCVIKMENMGDTLQWMHTTYAPNYYTFTINSGSQFHITKGDITIDLGGSASTPSPSILLYGKFIATGSVGHEVIIRNYGNILHTPKAGVNYIDWDYVKLQDTHTALGYVSLTYRCYSVGVGALKNVTFEQISAPVTYGAGIILASSPIGIGFVIEDCIFRNSNSHINFFAGELLKIKNSLFSKLDSVVPNLANPVVSVNSSLCYNPLNSFNKINQSQITFDGCIFESNYNTAGTKYAFYQLAYSAVAKFKNCTFRKEASSSIYRCFNVITGGSVAIFIGDNIFQDYTNTKWSKDSESRTLFGKDVSIRVLDENGAPIEDASVRITQAQEYEYWNWLTDSNGYVKDIFGDNCYLIEKEDTSATGTGTWVYWSDSIAAGRYHTITVYAPGRKSFTQNFILTETTAFEITLPLLAPQKRFDGVDWVYLDAGIHILNQ